MQKEIDLKGQYVLVSKNYHYWGSKAITLPDELQSIIFTRGHKCSFPKDLVKNFIDFIKLQPEGVLAQPSKWPTDDTSWKLGV